MSLPAGTWGRPERPGVAMFCPQPGPWTTRSQLIGKLTLDVMPFGRMKKGPTLTPGGGDMMRTRHKADAHLSRAARQDPVLQEADGLEHRLGVLGRHQFQPRHRLHGH